MVAEQFCDPVIELVIADICSVITHQVEGASHDLIVTELVGLLRLKVRQRGALDGVAVVEHDDGVGALLCADLFRDRGHAAHTQGSRGTPPEGGKAASAK